MPKSTMRFLSGSQLFPAAIYAALLVLFFVTNASSAEAAKTDMPPKSITVVMDDNYPPFIFRDASGQLQGILKDSWALWEARTGIAVDLKAMDWAKAQQVMQAGQADVIDTIFVNEPRKLIYDFSAPYAKLNVPIFFHQSIGGIVDADSLRGFTVGVKDGDACIDVLEKKGVDNIKRYPSFSAVVSAAAAGNVRVFCVDEPPAVYLLNQLGIEKEFRHSMPLYVGEFHRAVRKGNAAVLKLVEEGFGRISAAERQKIEQKWYGSEIAGPSGWRYARATAYALIGLLLIAIFLVGWNLTLRRRVRAKTAELSSAFEALGSAKLTTERTLAKLNATFAALPDLLFEMGLDGTYYEYHSAHADLLAAPADVLMGKTVSEMLPGDAAEVVMSALQEAHETGVSRNRQLVLTVPQGIRWFELSIARKAIEPGIAPRFIVISRDITERKRAETARAGLEAQLRETQKLEAIGTLAGGIAHDFNNILATILGNTELARLDMSAHPQALESLEEIRKASSRARDLVQQMLSFSRRQPTERKPVSLALVVEESVRVLRATLPAQITLEVHCDVGVPEVWADAVQIQQILINLATNAMQAMAGGPGCIGIRLDTVVLDSALAASHPALVALHSRHPGRTLRLAVSDNGPGIDAALIERIFEPFFTTKAVDEGPGLGLSVVHGVVQAHEGAIVVNSQPDRATIFTIYLPVALVQSDTPQPDHSELPTAAPPSTAGGRHILYLDDDESLVYLITRAMATRGIRISGYTKQRDALDAIQASPGTFDLVVTDYNMPGMSGLDVVREVRAIRPDLPVVVASGFIDEKLRTKAAGAGVQELIFKAGAVEALGDAFARLATQGVEK